MHRFYNPYRLHSSLDYNSSMVFERFMTSKLLMRDNQPVLFSWARSAVRFRRLEKEAAAVVRVQRRQMPEEQGLEGWARGVLKKQGVCSAEVDIVPLTQWNESILRYYFCRLFANDDTQVKQFIECDRIDLVLSRGTSRALSSSSSTGVHVAFDPYSEQMLGFKGGPGRKNLSEFQSCIDKLHERPYVPGLSKYVTLLYAEDLPDIGSRRKRRTPVITTRTNTRNRTSSSREVAVWNPS